MPKPFGANQDHRLPPHQPPRACRPRVRLAAPADAEGLAEVNLLTWRHAYAGIVPDAYLATLDRERLRDRWLTRIEEPAERVNLLAEVDGQIAAYAIVGSYRRQHDAKPEDTTAWGELYAIYTRPDLQRRGAGAAVHDAALEALGERGYDVFALWVLRANTEAQRWYGERGWHCDGASSEWLGSGVPLEEIRMIRDTNGSFTSRSSRLGR